MSLKSTDLLAQVNSARWKNRRKSDKEDRQREYIFACKAVYQSQWERRICICYPKHSCFLSYIALIWNRKFKNWIFNHKNLIITSVVEVEGKWTFPFIVGKNLISIYTNLKTIPIGTTVSKTSLRIFYKNEDKTTEGYKYNNIYYTAAAKSLQSCPTLCEPIDGSPPSSAVPGILQARLLEWVAISCSNTWKWKVKVKSLSRVRLLVTPWTAAYQALPSMGFFQARVLEWVPLPSPFIILLVTKKKKKLENIRLKIEHLIFIGTPISKLTEEIHGYK